MLTYKTYSLPPVNFRTGESAHFFLERRPAHRLKEQPNKIKVPLNLIPET